jgi:DNA-binding LacI/PurR family transcriptional regulator
MRISELAKQARVSPATVSRAINQPHIVSAESLARIRAVMKKNNYTPAPAECRRGPKKHNGEMRRIGVLFVGTKTGNPNLNWFQDQLHRIQAGNPRYRVDLSVLYMTSPDEIPPEVESGALDGLIIQGIELSPGNMEKISHKPCVWFMTRRSTGYAGDYVEPDNEANGRMAAEYLKSKGRKVVAAITSNPDYSAVARRTKAFAEHACGLGLEVHTILGKKAPDVGFLDFTPNHTESTTLVKRLLAIKPRPTGIYIPVDHFCGSLLRALREAGLRPYEDFHAIIGNYNPMIYHNLDHLPAAIDINLDTLVRKVMEHLLWRIENPDIPGRIGVTVSPSLITSEKTG